MLLVKNEHQLTIPRDFVTLEPDNENAHQFDDFYMLKAQATPRWNDQDIGLPLKCNPTLSDEGFMAPFLKDFESPSIFGGNA